MNERKTTVIYVHGKGGTAAEAAHYQPLFPGQNVIGFAYHAQAPWEAKAEFPPFFALSSLDETLVDEAYFISPVVDMAQVIGNMMQWANVTEQALEEKQEIPTEFGETLSWPYLCYVRAHPVAWRVPTRILYGERDPLTPLETITGFAKKTCAALTVMPGGEHWFHTKAQMQFLDAWITNSRGACEPLPPAE